MPRASNNGTELEYVTAGDRDDPALLLIMGLGAQMTAWDPELIAAFVDRGFFVITFDNRDIGLSSSTKTSIDIQATLVALVMGESPEVPYTLSDMADDAVAVLDAVGVDKAHIGGVSLGGMIAQTVAINHPERTLSLTSIMSTTGDSDVGRPRDDVAGMLFNPPPTDREAAIERAVEVFRTIGSPDHFEEDYMRGRAAQAYDRAFQPNGVALQLAAIAASGSRTADLAKVQVPTLVMHGDLDPLIDKSGGVRTAESVPGAELVILEGMGHDLPRYFWPVIVESVTQLAARAAESDATAS